MTKPTVRKVNGRWTATRPTYGLATKPTEVADFTSQPKALAWARRDHTAISTNSLVTDLADQWHNGVEAVPEWRPWQPWQATSPDTLGGRP